MMVSKIFRFHVKLWEGRILHPGFFVFFCFLVGLFMDVTPMVFSRFFLVERPKGGGRNGEVVLLIFVVGKGDFSQG